MEQNSPAADNDSEYMSLLSSDEDDQQEEDNYSEMVTRSRRTDFNRVRRLLSVVDELEEEEVQRVINPSPEPDGSESVNFVSAEEDEQQEEDPARPQRSTVDVTEDEQQENNDSDMVSRRTDFLRVSLFSVVNEQEEPIRRVINPHPEPEGNRAVYLLSVETDEQQEEVPVADVSRPQRSTVDVTEPNNEQLRVVVERVVINGEIPLEAPSLPAQPEQQSSSSSHNEPVEQPLPEPANDTPSRKRKSRTRSPIISPDHEKLRRTEEDSDDGSICSICLDNWEMTGKHRLTSLKCGHLFGHSCIKRWLQGCPQSSKVCPTCKTRAAVKDLRNLYAKRICVVDKSEEYRLRDLLNLEKNRNNELMQNDGMLRIELAMTKRQLKDVEVILQKMKNACDPSFAAPHSSQHDRLHRYKLSKDKDLEMTKDSGCRVMISTRNTPTLAISQKSHQSLFPGFGVRIFDIRTFRSVNFFHMSSKPIRDLSYSFNEEQIVAATLEKCVKLFNINDRTVVNTYTPSDKPIWACALDTNSKNFIYLGSSHGSTYLYDIRKADTVLQEFANEDDRSPVIAIATVPSSPDFPFGGFLVCKLQSLWFHEYMQDKVFSTRLNIEGPFVSMTYDAAANSLLAATRPSTKHCLTRYIVSKLIKLNELSALETIATFEGSKVAPVMSRSTQIIMEGNTLVSAYLQDRKVLGLWNLKDEKRTQSWPIADVVYDTCPIYNGHTTYVAALTEDKCRIYSVIPD